MVIRGLGCAGCGPRLVPWTPFPPQGEEGVGHLNKSLQCSEVSANRASVTGGGAPGAPPGAPGTEREPPGQRSGSFLPAKGSRRIREEKTARSAKKGLPPEPQLKAEECVR